MQKLLLLGTAAVVAVAAYVGLATKEQDKVAKSTPVEKVESSKVATNQDEVLVAAAKEVNKEKEAKEVLAQAAVAVSNEKATKKKITVKKQAPSKKENRKKSVLKPTAAKVTKVKSETEVVEDKVSTEQASTNTMQANLLGQGMGGGNRKFNANLSFIGSTDLKETTDVTKTYGSRMSLLLGYRINKTYSAQLITSYSKELSQGFDEQLNNTSIRLNHSPISINSQLMVIPRATGIYPTSKVSKVRDEMNGALAVSPLLIYTINNSFNFIYIPTAVGFSHKYKTNRVNQTNNQYSLSQTGILTYNLNDSYSLSSSFSYVQNWSYFGTEKDPQFATDVSGTYLFNREFLTAGVNTGGLLYESERGPNSFIEFYDPNKTSFYLVYGIAL